MIKKAKDLTYGDVIIAAVTANGNAEIGPYRVDANIYARGQRRIWYDDNMRNFYANSDDEFVIR